MIVSNCFFICSYSLFTYLKVNIPKETLNNAETVSLSSSGSWMDYIFLYLKKCYNIPVVVFKLKNSQPTSGITKSETFANILYVFYMPNANCIICKLLENHFYWP